MYVYHPRLVQELTAAFKWDKSQAASVMKSVGPKAHVVLTWQEWTGLILPIVV